MNGNAQAPHSDCIFCRIRDGKERAYVVDAAADYMAFLTPFPNTPGITLVIPKSHIVCDVFGMNVDQYAGYLDYVRSIAERIRQGLDVGRVALVFEGTGVAHLHAKLIPLHGALGRKTDVWAHQVDFHAEYPGYLTTLEGPPMPHEDLLSIRDRINSSPGGAAVGPPMLP